MTVGTFSRAAQLSAARGERGLDALPVRSVRRPPVEKELLSKVLGQLGKSGSNLNQLTALAHRQGLAPDVEAELFETLVEVRAAAQAVMQAMGRQA